MTPHPSLLQSVLEPYLPAAVFLFIVVATAAVMHGASYFLGPHRRGLKGNRPKNAADIRKESTYECGVPLLGPARQRFSVKFYLVAILFVLFDIETVFLIPWAVKFRVLFEKMGVFSLIEMFLFLGILGVGLLYAWRRGGLEWD